MRYAPAVIHSRRMARTVKLSEGDRRRLQIITEALDATTEFGLESASHGRLLQVIGGATLALRLLKQQIGER